MICNKCGKMNDENTQVCSGCGVDSDAGLGQKPVQQFEQQNNQTASRPARKSKKPLYFGIGIGGAAVVVLAFSLLVFPLFQKGTVDNAAATAGESKPHVTAPETDDTAQGNTTGDENKGKDDDEVTRTSGDGTPGEQITVLEIRGAFATPGVFTADPWYSYIAGDSSLTSNKDGEYSAVVYDRNGQQLSIAYFDVTDDYQVTTDEGALYGSSVGIPIRIIIRFPDTASKVVIYQGSSAIYTENLSANAPTVKFTCLSEGQVLGDNVTLTWDASDADGDELTFQIWYYRTMGEMYLVASDVKGNSLDVDLTKFPGSGSGWFGILVTDGSRTGMDETPRVSVPYNAPDILTHIPEDKQYKADSPIHIQGRVKDPQDGWLLDGYEWYIDGELIDNNGSSHLRLDPNTLAPGTYTITIVVTNSAGISSSRDYTIVVV